jgi:hypothetical protein
MKTNWQRHDDLTGILFKCESALLEGPIGETAPNQLIGLKKRFYELAKAGIANSHGLDHFLQVAMAWITTYWAEKTKEPNFRATVSLYLQPLKAILVKPCVVYPGRCQPPQPTISLKTGICGGIGHTGVSMLLDRILYCQPGEANCGQYIPIESGSGGAVKSFAALCIPLNFRALEKGLADLSPTAPCVISKEDCAKVKALSETDERAGNSRSQEAELRARWVLNIECVSKDLDRALADEILTDPEFKKVLKTMIVTLDAYQKGRDMHRALERASTLLALANNTMRPKPAYRALLQEISSLCDGADVTLHLRDLFDHRDPAKDLRDQKRCSVYVAGVGNNFRDFLINERIGLRTGQIGWALSKEEPEPGQVSNSNLVLKLPRESEYKKVGVQYIVGKEIEDALNDPDNALPFKQLMPETCLNVAVPIHFHDMKIGVINIEWDKKHLEHGFRKLNLGSLPLNLHKEGRNILEQKYLSDRLPLVYRMADYLSLVIDYFDDIDHLAKRPTAKQALNPEVMKRINHRGALRKILSYYVQQGMISADKQIKEGIKDLREAERGCLQDLVDAVGYFLATTTALRILVSVRRTGLRPEGPVLEPHVRHWLEGDSNSTIQERLNAPIPIEDMKTVLATVAYRGVPLFGEISPEGDKMLLDKTWEKLFEDHHGAVTDAEITAVPYSAAGENPRYETAVPLVFGERLLGTFDFEQFELEPAGSLELELDERGLCAHLEWGRAISFLIAYLEDAKEDARLESGKRSEHFHRFQLLCAQLIAEVPVAAEHLREIATDTFAEIIPVEDVNVDENLTAEKIKGRQFAQLEFRGGGNDWLTWKISETQSQSPSQPEDAPPRKVSRALLDSQIEAEAGKTVPAMMASYHALIQELQSKPSDDPFLDAIERIIDDLQISERDLLDDPSLDAGESVLRVFSFLEDALRRSLRPQPGKPHKVKDYAWFLHVLCFDSKTGDQALVCNPDPAEPEKRLAYCNTHEMEEIVNTVMSAPEAKRLEKFRDLLKHRAEESKSGKISPEELAKAIKEMETDLQGVPTEESLIRVITDWLCRPKKKHRPKSRETGENVERQHSDVSDDEKRASGFTWAVARAGHPIVVPQINLSPNRSERGLGWFWREPYTVLGIPFKLNPGKPDEECIAVLNIFRRRESSSDMNFFRIDERDKARELANAFNTLLEKLVELKHYPVLSDEDLRAGLSELKRELIERARDKTKKLIVVQTPFARSAESFEEIREHVFANATEPEISNPVFRPEQENRSFTDRNVVIRLGEKDRGKPDKLNALGPKLAEDAGFATRVFLFVSNSEDIVQNEVPLYSPYFQLHTHDDSLLQRDGSSKEESLYSQWLLGKARTISSGTGVLARRTGRYSHSEFEAWALEFGKTTEQADYYRASGHLKKPAAWRPSNEVLSLAAFEKGGEAK